VDPPPKRFPETNVLVPGKPLVRAPGREPTRLRVHGENRGEGTLPDGEDRQEPQGCWRSAVMRSEFLFSPVCMDRRRWMRTRRRQGPSIHHAAAHANTGCSPNKAVISTSADNPSRQGVTTDPDFTADGAAASLPPGVRTRRVRPPPPPHLPQLTLGGVSSRHTSFGVCGFGRMADGWPARCDESGALPVPRWCRDS
jgi:hypothetical protein